MDTRQALGEMLQDGFGVQRVKGNFSKVGASEIRRSNVRFDDQHDFVNVRFDDQLLLWDMPFPNKAHDGQAWQSAKNLDPRFSSASSKSQIVNQNSSVSSSASEKGLDSQAIVNLQSSASSVCTRHPNWMISLSEEQQVVQACALEAGKKLGLSTDDIVRAYEVFCWHDKDQSGMVAGREVRDILQNLTKVKLGRKDMQHIFGSAGLNKNGMLDFSEFLMCVCQLAENRSKYLDAAVLNRTSSGKKLHGGQFQLRMVGLPFSAVCGYIQKEIEEMTAFLAIPIIFLLFFCFVLSSHFHREVSVLHSFEESIRTDIETNTNFGFSSTAPFENGRGAALDLTDIQNIADFWSWMDLGLMPLFFPAGWHSSEARANVEQYCTSPILSMMDNGWNEKFFTGNVDQYADRKAFYLDEALCSMNSMPEAFPQSLNSLEEYANATKKPYRFFNEVVAGVRLTQEQLSHQSCPRPEFEGQLYMTPCLEESDWTWLKPDMSYALHMQDDLVGMPGGKTVYLKSATSLSEVKAILQKLEDDRWFNPRTSKIQILFTSYNNHMDLFTASYVNILVNRAGNIHKVVQPVCIWLAPYRHKTALVADIIMTLLVLKLSWEEATDIGLHIKKFGLKQGFRNYFYSVKNIIDWATVAYSLINVIFWLVWCTKVWDFVDLLGTARADVIGSWPSDGDVFTPSNEKFWDDVDDLVHFSQHLSYVFAFYPFVLGARLFCAFGGQPRLGLVTATLTHASKDIIHFLCVLLVALMVFCSSAEYLFSIQVPEYENFGRTFMSVFRAMLGDYDFTELSQQGRLPAAIWFLGFMVLVHMIMLNMLLAIIMDVYGTLKAGMSEDEETIWSQAWEIWYRWRKVRQGQEMPLKLIVQHLIGHRHLLYVDKEVNGVIVQDLKLITIGLFMEIVPGLGEDQAESLMMSAHTWWNAINEEQVTPVDLQSMVRMIDMKVELAQATMNSIEETQTRFGTIREASQVTNQSFRNTMAAAWSEEYSQAQSQTSQQSHVSFEQRKQERKHFRASSDFATDSMSTLNKTQSLQTLLSA